MRRFFAIAFVLLFTGLGAAGGYFGAAVYVGARGSLEGMSLACHALQTAESRQVITRQQRAAIIDTLMQTAKGAGDEPIVDSPILIDYLKGDCSQSLWEAMMKAA